MDRKDKSRMTLRILKNSPILIKTSTSERYFLKIYSPYSEIYRNYQKTLRSTTAYD